MLQTIQKNEKKNVYQYNCGITIQHVHGMKYTSGKDDIHITIDGSSSTDGANWNDELAIPESTKFLLGTLGARATKKHIIYGKQYVPKNSALSKLKDYMALAELLETELKSLKQSKPWTSDDYYTFDDACNDGIIGNNLENSKNNSIFINS